MAAAYDPLTARVRGAAGARTTARDRVQASASRSARRSRSRPENDRRARAPCTVAGGRGDVGAARVDNQPAGGAAGRSASHSSGGHEDEQDSRRAIVSEFEI